MEKSQWVRILDIRMIADYYPEKKFHTKKRVK
jgi:hypothetical protein